MALTKTDIDRIDKRFNRRLKKQKVEILTKLDSQKEDILEEMDNKLQHLKGDFFERIDPILKEVMTAREERPLIENRLEILEKIHPKGKHILSSQT